MATSIRPLYDRVILKRLTDEKYGGIIIPDTATKERPQEVEVVAVGPGKVREDGTRTPLDVKPGDRVLMPKYSGSEFKIDGEEFFILREDEILGILESASKSKTAGK